MSGGKWKVGNWVNEFCNLRVFFNFGRHLNEKVDVLHRSLSLSGLWRVFLSQSSKL